MTTDKEATETPDFWRLPIYVNVRARDREAAQLLLRDTLPLVQAASFQEIRRRLLEYFRKYCRLLALQKVDLAEIETCRTVLPISGMNDRPRWMQRLQIDSSIRLTRPAPVKNEAEEILYQRLAYQKDSSKETQRPSNLNARIAEMRIHH